MAGEKYQQMETKDVQQQHTSFNQTSPMDVAAAHEKGRGNTSHDMADMQRLGKKQEFKRNFNLISILGFVSIYMASWFVYTLDLLFMI
ncbi:hypothetical protein GJ744_009986 [Endocarpon pusillum]|uniref:Uncharacterized protein n=1 Tax=Endocarpon pusillum TaxID=364733 RepID=A0A8H7AJ63_9EURO|nr:hypothetical protein GJ744_009986 [Endocarpon pusillum]